MADMVIKQWPIAKLVPYARNAKKHSAAQVEQIAQSIKTFGFRVPALVNFKTGELIAGHGRVKGAAKAGLAEVPCVDGSDMSPELQRAYRIADNKLAESPWDEAVAAQELADLKRLGVDIRLTGFEDDELAEAAKGSGVEEVDVAALEDRFWISLRGPLKQQAKVLQALRKSTAGIEGVEVELGTRDEI